MPSVSSYTHTQSTPSLSWTVNHNLNTPAPVCDVFVDLDGVLTKILPKNISVSNNNTLVVSWSSPRSGIVAVR